VSGQLLKRLRNVAVTSPTPRRVRHDGWLANAGLSLLLAGLGLFALEWRETLWSRLSDDGVDWQEMSMDQLQRFSYDVPFIVRHSLPWSLRPVAGPPRPTDQAVIIGMDEESAQRLGQPPGGPWSRAMHAKLLDRLTEHGARAVVFDIIFDYDSPDDAVFAEALARNGNAFLGATIHTNTEAPLTPEEMQRFLQIGIAKEQLSKRNKTLYQAARGWGLVTFRPMDSDYGVRRIYPGKLRAGLDPWPAATWQVAKAMGANLPEDDVTRFARRWVNYYGSAGQIESLSYHRALAEDGGIPPGYFKGKVVFIGARSQIGTGPNKLLDEFSTPWSRFRGRSYTPGVEIHATIFLNLLNHDWLERLSISLQRWTVVLIGLLLGLLRWLRPWRAVLTAMFAAFLVAATACLLQWHARVWWNWAVPVFVQIPLATVLAVGSRYYIEERGKRKLRSAFSYYLSPELADEIAEGDFTLEPNGTKVTATMVFTDMVGFATLSEKLGDSSHLGEVLKDYFTRTTDEILAEKGTVIKFIGDAVFAAWGAPLNQPDQAERAVRAAWRLAKTSQLDVQIPRSDGTIEVFHVRTRVGIHTGEALAGNLGSRHRFDYTLIGDATNFANRLEGLNKYLNTSILLSDDTAQRLGGKFLLRRLGKFKVIGKAESVAIHELLGEKSAERPAWLDSFDRALAAWTAGDFSAAATGFESVKAARNGTDGPSHFYLELLRRTTPSPGWTGEVTLDAK
jgi:adenylate cyclase